MIAFAKALAVAGVFSLTSLTGIGAHPTTPIGTHSTIGNHSGGWDVLVRVKRCPMGALCFKGYGIATYPEPNYGQALKVARELTAEGFDVIGVVQESGS